MTVTLTVRAVEALKPTEKQRDIWDAVVPGLGVRVSPGGQRTYFIRYRHGGKHRRLVVGKHPHLALADARDKARELLARAHAGDDPATARRAARAKAPTFRDLVAEVMAAKASRTRPSTQRERQRVAACDLLPVWGDRPAASITRRDVVELLDTILRRGAPTQANRTFSAIRAIFNEGLRRGFPGLTVNPAAMLPRPAEEKPRDRFLDRRELAVVWQATEWEALVTRGIFRLALLTAQRIGNVRALRWDQIDASDVWRIPAAAFKGRRAHWVPLSAEALAELDALRPLTGGDEFAFPGRADGKTGHVTSTNSALDRLVARSGLPTWTAHDFRRTFRTHATRPATPSDPRDPAGLGVAPWIADAVLGHREQSLGFGTYTGEQASYLLSEKRDALQRWGAFVADAVQDGGA